MNLPRYLCYEKQINNIFWNMVGYAFSVCVGACVILYYCPRNVASLNLFEIKFSAAVLLAVHSKMINWYTYSDTCFFLWKVDTAVYRLILNYLFIYVFLGKYIDLFCNIWSKNMLLDLITSNILSNMIRMKYMPLMVADNDAKQQDNRIYDSCPWHICNDIRKSTPLPI